MLSTAWAWMLATTIYAYFYVSRRISIPDAEGYEKLWDWQLFFFSIVRLPLLLCVLGTALFIEYLLTRKAL